MNNVILPLILAANVVSLGSNFVPSSTLYSSSNKTLISNSSNMNKEVNL